MTGAVMTADEIAFMSVAELGQAYRSGSLSPVDVVRVSIQRLERLEPALRAARSASRPLIAASSD
ncbi:Asp-tRNA(Asn)/Glu-tRNA(Gln) amidotransferase A subunit family amidase [Rhizobium sp. BK275]|uniref:hypothetical protein n=1 Tax=Rhizobium sp. BK275 TaxID=2587077 RepID=UPI00161C850D|nr:hypothetical protein [Rhizobium sp. BK275]MBB3387494.1 Asp-tRNA(Asn)/Glu-tRNA(Gln) amidotransferase A subunit family amidase [Rhizobium sp. BK275]